MTDLIRPENSPDDEDLLSKPIAVFHPLKISPSDLFSWVVYGLLIVFLFYSALHYNDTARASAGVNIPLAVLFSQFCLNYDYPPVHDPSSIISSSSLYNSGPDFGNSSLDSEIFLSPELVPSDDKYACRMAWSYLRTKGYYIETRNGSGSSPVLSMNFTLNESNDYNED